MKLTTLLLITAIMQVSASSFAQKITLSEKNAQLATVFEKIRTQSGYDFIVTRDMLKLAKPVSIMLNNAELKDALENIFVGQPLDFSIEGKIVVVSKKEASLIDVVREKVRSFLVADSVVFKGRVVDEKGFYRCRGRRCG